MTDQTPTFSVHIDPDATHGPCQLPPVAATAASQINIEIFMADTSALRLHLHNREDGPMMSLSLSGHVLAQAALPTAETLNNSKWATDDIDAIIVEQALKRIAARRAPRNDDEAKEVAMQIDDYLVELRDNLSGPLKSYRGAIATL